MCVCVCVVVCVGGCVSVFQQRRNFFFVCLFVCLFVVTGDGSTSAVDLQNASRNESLQ